MDLSIESSQYKEWTNILLLHKFAIEEINTKLRILNQEFIYIHNYNPIEHLKDRVKKPENIVEKLERKGIDVTIENARKHINDIAGIRIICSFNTDIYKLYEIIEGQNDINVLRVKDYIRNPKENGYRSLHMLIEIPVFLTDKVENIKVEIQIRTIAMDFWASLEHKIYYKHQGNAPKYISKELKECAEMIEKLDKKMLNIRNDLNKLDTGKFSMDNEERKIHLA